MNRKNFLHLSTFAAGAWFLSGFYPGDSSAVNPVPALEFSPDPLLKISHTGEVTVYIRKQEMGQKVVQSLPLLVAEELEIDPQAIIIETLPFQVSKAGSYTTWASDSIKDSWMHLRKTGAMAKTMLVTAAATKWKVSADKCRAQNATVINTITNEVLQYKDLVKDASALTPPEQVVLKRISDFKVIGRKKLKTNLDTITSGRYKYSMDVKLPGMFYAALVRCPVFSGKVESWDDSALSGIKGFVKILPVVQVKEALNRNAIAIIATNTWAALEGQRLLKVKWSYEPATAASSRSLFDQFRKELLTSVPAEVYGKEKDAAFKGISGPDVFEARYEVPFLAHATMEPMNCTAWYKDGKFEIWGGFQAPMYINDILPKVFGLEKSSISVNLMPMGGSFGRKEKIDNVADAMQLSRALSAPVQVMYNRMDDMQNDFYRPASLHHLAAVATPAGISQWRHQLGISTFPGKEISGPWHSLGGVTNDLCYEVENYQSAFYPVESPVPLGSWRSIAFSPNVFAIESFMDELAIHNHIDPVTFRLNLLRDPASADKQRLRNVISGCADAIGWRNPRAKGRSLGIACCMYGHSNSYAAHAMEVSVSADKLVTIHRCVAVVDCGLVIDADGLKAQIEGSFVWALGGIFKNEITVSNSMVDQQTFNDYDVLRINEMPPLEIILLDSGENPGGGGEPAVPSVGPALCNALFAATGVRIRELPVKKHGFRLNV